MCKDSISKILRRQRTRHQKRKEQKKIPQFHLRKNTTESGSTTRRDVVLSWKAAQDPNWRRGVAGLYP